MQTSMSKPPQVTEDLIISGEPEIGAGDESKCLPGWIKSFIDYYNTGEGITLSHEATKALLHTLVAAKARAKRLVAERDWSMHMGNLTLNDMKVPSFSWPTASPTATIHQTPIPNTTVTVSPPVQIAKTVLDNLSTLPQHFWVTKDYAGVLNLVDCWENNPQSQWSKKHGSFLMVNPLDNLHLGCILQYRFPFVILEGECLLVSKVGSLVNKVGPFTRMAK
jgi:hypothetical protein